MIPISVCIIAKNEEKIIEEFLVKLRAFDWEIVVTDTGSTDRTREIALKYADKVVDFKWIDDFSAAKNFCISHACNDQILSLDCDELLSDIHMDEILALIEEHPADLGRIMVNNHLPLNGKDSIYKSPLERFFSKQEYYFDYPIHEQLMRRHNSEISFYDVPLTVEHLGYSVSEEEKARKLKRNNDLLFKELKKHPDDAYTNFQIGQSYLFTDDYESALQYFGKAIACPNFSPSLTYSFVLVQGYGECLLQTGREKEAMSLLNIHEFFDESADYHCLLGRIYFANGDPLKAMLEFIRATQSTVVFVSDSKNNIPYFNMGRINEMLGNKEGALTQYRLCSSFPMAEERINALEGSF